MSTYVHAAEPVLNRLEPQGGQRGTELTVSAIGARLGDEPYQVLFYEPGVDVTDFEKIDDNNLKLTVRIADDCQLGRHGLRLRTASGLSNLLTFHVGALQEVKEVEPNNDLGAAQEIALGVTVNGLVQVEDVDVYAVNVAEGERLSVEIEGLRLGRMFFDPVLEVYDEDGNSLARSDDSPAAFQDAFVSLRAPQTGRVLIHVRESAYRGGGAATYRMHVGRFPRPRAVFPPAVAVGQEAKVKWIGDPLGETEQTVTVAADDEETFDLFPTDDSGIAPSSLPLLLAATPPVIEVEPNSKVDAANEIGAPGVACGVIQEPGDRDYFRFAAKKGQVFDVRVRARELRSPLDAVLRIREAKGKVLAGSDDDRGKPDSYLRFTAPADGDYVLEVEDRLLRGQPDMVYALDVAQPKPVTDLQIHEYRRYEARVIEVPQGGRTATLMTATRRDFGGPLKTNITDLPAGVTVEAPMLPANYNLVPLLFDATEQAEIGAALAPVTVELTENPQPVKSNLSQQTWLVRGRNNRPVWSHFSRRLPVAVTTALPFSIRLEQPKSPLVLSGEKQLKVVAERKEGFEEPIRVRMLYNPPGTAANASRSIPKGQNEVLIPMTANGNARVADWPIVVLGETTLNGRIVVSTQIATLQVAKPHFNATVPTLNTVQGSGAELVVKLEQVTPYEGEAEIELVRLPPGVTAEKRKATAESTSIVFQVNVAKDARVGRHRGVACRTRLVVNGEPVIFTQGYAELRVDPPPPEPPAQTAKSGSDQGDKAS